MEFVHTKKMDCEHFSHPHNLSFHQMPQGAEISCSGCHFPATGSLYVCHECKFFLHEQCFSASRSMKHPSHPSHSLTLVPYPTYPSRSFFCNSCNLPGTGFCYGCSSCDFDLHVHCAYMSKNAAYDSQSGHVSNKAFSQPNHANCAPNPTGNHPPPQAIDHKSHPNHRLELISPPPYESSEFSCDGCGETGKDKTFHCHTCNFDLHPKCISLPETVTRQDHPHPLSLQYTPQLSEGITGLSCDVCFRNVKQNLWVYRCLDCEFDTHVKCVKMRALTQAERLKLQADEALAQQVELMNLQWKVQTNAMACQIRMNSVYNLRFL